MDALADVEALLSYTPAYRRVEVLDRSDDGRPTPRAPCGQGARQARWGDLEFHWRPDSLVWDTAQTKQQYAQRVEYRLRPDHIDTSTTVTVVVTVEPD